LNKYDKMYYVISLDLSVNKYLYTLSRFIDAFAGYIKNTSTTFYGKRN